MARKIIIYAGAPDAKALDWSSQGLLSHFQGRIARFTGLPQAQAQPGAPSAGSAGGSAQAYPAWRAIPLQKGHITTGFSQVFAVDFVGGLPSHTDFFTTAAAVSFATSDASGDGDTADGDATAELLSQFYEHSLLAHTELPSSQLVPSDSSSASQQATESFLTAGSTSSYVPASQDAAGPQPRPPPLPHHGNPGSLHLSDLEDVPPASYLLQIQPQTMTVNLIVGIISIASPRTIQTRWGRTSSLVEVLVGDDTRSGFAITFWQAADKGPRVGGGGTGAGAGAAGAGAAEGGSVLAGLQPQDVVLMRNVALNVFTGKVYGSSLRRDLTKMHLLYRKQLGAAAAGHYTAADFTARRGADPQLDKTRRVREWVLNFVGGGGDVNDGGAGPSRRGKGVKTVPAKRRWDMPPDDTQ